ncbi:MAG: hypothetical protein ACO3UU_16070, partial [Minisyncoccia bacterium]
MKAVVDDNIICHFHGYRSGGGSAINIEGKSRFKTNLSSKLNTAIVVNNSVYLPNNIQVLPNGYGGLSGGIRIIGEDKLDNSSDYQETGVSKVKIANNKISTNGVNVSILTNVYTNTIINNYIFENNKYHTTTGVYSDGRFNLGTNYSNISLSQWKAVGYDLDVNDVPVGTQNIGIMNWPSPQRDIISYMESIDPSYQPDENVYVDEGSYGPKQTTRQKVWEVIRNFETINQYHIDRDGLCGGPCLENAAKLIARRYH